MPAQLSKFLLSTGFQPQFQAKPEGHAPHVDDLPYARGGPLLVELLQGLVDLILVRRVRCDDVQVAPDGIASRGNLCLIGHKGAWELIDDPSQIWPVPTSA
jgi:hypothetical protein